MRTSPADRPRSASSPDCDPTPRTRREARELAARHRRRTLTRAAGATVVGLTAPALAVVMVATGVVGLPDRVSAGTPVTVAEQAGADTLLAGSVASALDRDGSVASRGAVSRMSLARGLDAAAAGREAMATHLAVVDTSLAAGVETTAVGQSLAREIAAARAFHEPVLDAHLTSSFGWRWGRMHNGIDFGAGHGAPLYAVGRGTVSTAGWNSGLGYHVKITLDTGETVVYGHLSRITVDLHQQVVAGTAIGQVGSTGRSTGAHLHLEVRTPDGPIDPEPWLAARRG